MKINEFPNLSDFKDVSAGQTCLIVGNGPSLRKTPLDKLRHFDSFAMNRISKIFSRTRWRPTFVSCVTTNVSNPEWKHDIEVSRDLGTPFFLWDKLAADLAPDHNTYLLNCTNGEQNRSEPEDGWWSWDPQSRVTKYGSSIIVPFQLAAYFGYKRIILVGCDLGFRDTKTQRLLKKYGRKDLALKLDRNHFTRNYGTPGWKPEVMNLTMLGAHKLAARMCQKAGIEIVNASVGGDLTIHSRQPVESFFS